MSKTILPFNTTHAVLEVVGGKGRSLSEMTGAGLPVPGGFHITTAAYRDSVADNHLQSRILNAVQQSGKAAIASEHIATLLRKLKFRSHWPKISKPPTPTSATILPLPYAPLPTRKICPTCHLPDSRIPISILSAKMR